MKLHMHNPPSANQTHLSRHAQSVKKNAWNHHKTSNISIYTGLENKQQLACTGDAFFHVCIWGEFKPIALRWRSSFAQASECSCACNIGTGHLRQRSSFAGFTGCLRVMASILNYPFIYLLLASPSMLEKDPIFLAKKIQLHIWYWLQCNRSFSERLAADSMTWWDQSFLGSPIHCSCSYDVAHPRSLGILHVCPYMTLYEEVCAVVHRNDIAVGGSGDQSTLGVFAPALQVTVNVLWPSNPHSAPVTMQHWLVITRAGNGQQAKK